MQSFQEIILTLKQYWADRGCIIQEPYDTEVGAGTMCPETFLRVLGPDPYRTAYVQPSRRPADGRYGDNPNRLYKHSQLQVILKPAPADVIEQYLGSLEAIGIDLKQHDLKLEEDNWEAPTLGAWGIGWQVMLDGLEISQFTYFQQCGGIDLDLVPAELTYGLERLTAFLQVKDSVYDIEWAPGFSYGDVRYKDELQYSVYNFEMADIATLWKLFDLHEGEATRLVQLYDPKSAEKKRFPLLPAYDQVLKCSNLFNTLDARGAISVTERVGVIQRVRKMAVAVAAAWADQQQPVGAGCQPAGRLSIGHGGHPMSLPFLLEIGTEEIPDWMIATALENLRLSFEKLEIPHESVRLDATPRRLVLRAEGLPARQPDSVERVLGPPKAAPAQAVAGFARKQGIQPEDLKVESTPKGEYYTYLKKVPGRNIIDLLAEALPGVILGLYFPKTMYWTGKGGPRFIRPIRWIVALLGEDIIPFELAGVRSGALTSGHRRLGAREIAVTTADYEQRLSDHGVVLSAEERRNRIRQGMAGIRIKPDDALLETLVYLTECPMPIQGSLRPAIPGTARRSSHHRDAPPPALLLRGGCRRQTGARSSSPS